MKRRIWILPAILAFLFRSSVREYWRTAESCTIRSISNCRRNCEAEGEAIRLGEDRNDGRER